MRNPFKIYLDWVNTNDLNDKKNEYTDSIQVREFNGQLYICYKDIPLVRQDHINGDICKVVQECRNSAIQSLS